MKIKYRIIAGRVTPVAVVTNSFDEVRARKLGFRHIEVVEATREDVLALISKSYERAIRGDFS